MICICTLVVLLGEKCAYMSGHLCYRFLALSLV
jgi:hypothetical protein